ncbi:MFS transporter [Saccharothrix variisporea]|uniref:MFS transporter n=1 Tax=Saccharothrix variisporea TaxID=543527 RepID=A0A495XLX1_9PSEU|nr:MFS transporter [Saccharothrix variisporea]RKT73453.1 MFS transporter [Saccharothrix variisporea]
MTTGVAARPKTGLRIFLLAFAQFIVAMDYNIVFVALPDIGRALDFSAQSLQWVLSAYAVGLGGFLLFGGRVVDRLGARRAFVAGLVLFGLACLAGGVATDQGFLVAARAAQGLGGALLTPATLALIGSGFAEGPERNRALSVWGAAGSGGLAVGALLGGVLTDAWGWEWVLLVMVPFALGAAVLAPFVLAPDAVVARGRRGFDVLGTLLATAASVLLVLGLVTGPESGWARGGLTVLAGLVVLGVFLLVERRTREPLVPTRLLGNRALLTAIGVILVFQSSLGGAYYLTTTYLQDTLGYRPLAAGLVFLPLTLVSMTASIKLLGPVIARWGVRRALVVGMVGNGLGIGLLAAGMAVHGGFWLLLPGLVVWGVGGGITFPAMFITASAGVDAGQEGVASAVATTAQQVGGAMGLAVLVAIAGTALGTAGAALVAGLATVVVGLGLAARR